MDNPSVPQASTAFAPHTDTTTGNFVQTNGKDANDGSSTGKFPVGTPSFAAGTFAASPYTNWPDAGSPSSHGDTGGKPDERKKRRAQQSREASREYRKRKKSHVEELEGKNALLASENDILRKRLAELERVQSLLHETGVLKKDVAAPQLQEDWKKDFSTLEELLHKRQEDEQTIAAVLDEMQLKGKQLLAAYKTSHVSSMDWTVFANFALFGVDHTSHTIKSTQISLVEPDSRQSINFWLELTKELDITDAQRKLIEDQLFTLRHHFLSLKSEQETLNEDLLELIRHGLKINCESPVDIQHIVTVTTKLGELQKNYEAHWGVWERAMETIMSLLTPLQKARILLRKKAFLDNLAALNSIWLSLNGRTPSAPAASWHPSLYPPVPLPAHLHHFL